MPNSVSPKKIMTFSPQTIPGLKLWLDSSDTSSISGSAWTDKSSGKYVFSSISNITRVSTGIVINQDGNKTLYNAAIPILDTYSLFAVGQTTSYGGSYRRLVNIGDDVIGFFGTLDESFATFTGYSTGWNDVDANTPAQALSENTQYLMGMIVSGAVLTPYFNGIALDTKYGATVSAIGMTIGAFVTNGQVWNGNVAEVIMIDGAVSDIQRQQIEGYLANRWGLAAQLPATHPYYSSSAAIIRQPYSRTFQPVDITGCAMWLDAADKSSMTFSGSNITQWNDKSGNGYNATVAPGYTAAIYSDAYSAVEFTSSADNAYVTSYPADPVSETMFVVANNPSPSGNNNIIIGGSFGARSLGFGFNPQNSLAYLNNQVVWLASTGADTYTSGTTALMTGYTTATGNNSNISINGGAITSFNSEYSFQNGTTYLGADTTSPFYYYVGYAMEIIFFNRVLTNTEILQVQSYLAHKWNISASLPAEHPGRYLPSYTTMFTPKALGTLNLWLDAADASTITLSSGNVNAWVDKSGTGYSAVPFTGDNTGVLATTNGITSIYGSTYPFRMYIPSFAWNNAFTQFIVAKGIYTIGTNLAADPLNGGGWYKYMLTGNWSLFALPGLYGTDTRYVRGPEDPYPGAPNLLPGAINMWAIFCIGSNLGATLSHYTLDGSSGLSYLDYGGGGVPAGSETGNFIINGLSTYGLSTPTNLGEIVHYNRSLSVNERQQVEGYLAWKWAIQDKLPSIHPYAKFQP